MSATGTPTPNIGLRIPLGTDPASVDDINYNSNLIDTKLGAVGNDSVQDQIDTLSTNTTQTLGKVQDGLAIVANGNTHVAIPADYFVYVKGHNSLSEGLYKNTSGSTIAANATLSTSNLTADDDGGLNSVYSTLNSKIEPFFNASAEWINNTDVDTIQKTGLYPIGAGNTHAAGSWGIMFVIAPRADMIEQIHFAYGNIYIREYRSSTGWTQWYTFARQ